MPSGSGGTESDTSPISRIRRLAAQAGGIPAASACMVELLNRRFPFTVAEGSLQFDTANPLALNSLRAEFRTQDGQYLFLKCHHEEGENDRVGEYYRSGILEGAGFPIDKALYQSSTVGEQLVIYRYRDRARFPELHGVARAVEAAGCRETDMAPVVRAFDCFQQQIGARYLDSLHTASPAQIADEAVHGLYHRRLVDREDDEAMGGRVREFYLDQTVGLPGDRNLAFGDFWHLRWQINGRRYELTLHEAFQRARRLLKPTPSSSMAAVTAHGDDHTGNLLYDPTQSAEKAILYFDPAFAGRHVPALQAPCKSLYHVCYAHPDMLYDPGDLQVKLSVVVEEGALYMEHDWQLTPLRQSFLDSQIEHVWLPLIQALGARGALPAQWKAIIASSLFCCPVLCKNLLAGAGRPNPLTAEASVLTFSIALQLAHDLFVGQLSDDLMLDDDFLYRRIS